MKHSSSPKPKLWLVILTLFLASLACNFGQPDEIIPTPAPPTSTVPAPEQATNTPEAVPPTQAPAEPTAETPDPPTRQLPTRPQPTTTTCTAPACVKVMPLRCICTAPTCRHRRWMTRNFPHRRCCPMVALICMQ